MMELAGGFPSSERVRLVQTISVTSLTGSYPMKELYPGISPP